MVAAATTVAIVPLCVNMAPFGKPWKRYILLMKFQELKKKNKTCVSKLITCISKEEGGAGAALGPSQFTN